MNEVSVLYVVLDRYGNLRRQADTLEKAQIRSTELSGKIELFPLTIVKRTHTYVDEEVEVIHG